MKRCLDEGLLQAYIDGELSNEQASEAAAHLSACATCADAFASAESEAAFFAASFAPDESLSVPTEALRARINAAVARLEPSPESNQGGSRGWGFGGLVGTLSGLFAFTPQGAVAFAGLLAILALAVVLFVAQKAQQPSVNNQIAKSEIVAPPSATPNGGNASGDLEEPPTGATPKAAGPTTSTKASYVPRRANKRRSGRGRDATDIEREQTIPGEKDYQTAIASLEKTIKLGGDAVLKPAVRIQYERNLAILDSAIGETRRVATANPKDKDAVGFLMATYQSKVELLTKVAEQAQVAALGR